MSDNETKKPSRAPGAPHLTAMTAEHPDGGASGLVAASEAGDGGQAACTHDGMLMMGELYGELSDLDHAEFHGLLHACENCRSQFALFAHTRAQLTGNLLETPPAELQDRILAAVLAPVPKPVTREGSRGGKLFTLLGRWAMRPETAMAALFLLIIGSSALLLRSGGMSSQPAMSVVDSDSVNAPAAVAASAAAQYDRAPSGPARLAARAETPSSRAAVGHNAAAFAPPPASPSIVGDSKGSSPPGEPGYGGQGGRGSDTADLATDGLVAKTMQNARAAAGSDSKVGEVAEAKAVASETSGSNGAFTRGMTAYRARNFQEALAQFDAAAKAGDAASELWAARSVREGNGCATALTRLEHAAAANPGTPVGNDATFESGKCYQAIGNLDAANARFQRVASVPALADRVANELAANQRIANARAERARAGAAAGGVASPAARPASKVEAPAASTTP
jgi:hypothetical protein